MPYANVPKSMWGKMDDCVAKVKAKGKGKNAYAICYASVVGKDVAGAARSRLKKGGKK
jgi:hypothetical protein